MLTSKEGKALVARKRYVPAPVVRGSLVLRLGVAVKSLHRLAKDTVVISTVVRAELALQRCR